MFSRIRASIKNYEELKANSVPFYVSNEGALFAKADEVINSKVVREQLEDFARLRDCIIDRKNCESFESIR